MRNACKTDRCLNCKHFANGHFEHNESVFHPEKGCRIVESDNADFGVCLHEKIGSDYVDDWLDRSSCDHIDGMRATCDEGRGHLMVGKDFGCVHFEPKPPAQVSPSASH